MSNVRQTLSRPGTREWRDETAGLRGKTTSVPRVVFQSSRAPHGGCLGRGRARPCRQPETSWAGPRLLTEHLPLRFHTIFFPTRAVATPRRLRVSAHADVSRGNAWPRRRQAHDATRAPGSARIRRWAVGRRPPRKAVRMGGAKYERPPLHADAKAKRWGKGGAPWLGAVRCSRRTGTHAGVRARRCPLALNMRSQCAGGRCTVQHAPCARIIIPCNEQDKQDKPWPRLRHTWHRPCSSCPGRSCAFPRVWPWRRRRPRRPEPAQDAYMHTHRGRPGACAHPPRVGPCIHRIKGLVAVERSSLSTASAVHPSNPRLPGFHRGREAKERGKNKKKRCFCSSLGLYRPSSPAPAARCRGKLWWFQAHPPATNLSLRVCRELSSPPSPLCTAHDCLPGLPAVPSRYQYLCQPPAPRARL